MLFLRAIDLWNIPNICFSSRKVAKRIAQKLSSLRDNYTNEIFLTIQTDLHLCSQDAQL